MKISLFQKRFYASVLVKTFKMVTFKIRTFVEMVKRTVNYRRIIDYKLIPLRFVFDFFVFLVKYSLGEKIWYRFRYIIGHFWKEYAFNLQFHRAIA